MRVFDIGTRQGSDVVSNRILTIPNALSFARLLALPVIYLDLVAGRHLRALLLLAVFTATDWLDGYLARRLRQVTRLGQLLDPISDRILFVVVGVGMVVGGLLPLWAFVALLSRDVLVLLVGAIVLLRGGRPPVVTRLGKTATFWLMWALPLFVLASILGDGAAAPQPVVQVLAWVLFGLGLLLYWIAVVDYGRTLLTGPSDGDMVD